MVTIDQVDSPLSDGDAAFVAGLRTARLREVLPDEPAIPAAEIRAETRPPPPSLSLSYFLAQDDGLPAGFGVAGAEHSAANRHLAWGEVLVAVEHRRRGIGTALFETVLDAARAGGRTLFTMHSLVGSVAGDHFARSMGARADLTEEVNRAPTAIMDRPMLESWVARAPERASGYSLVAWDGLCPPEWQDQMADAAKAMNDAPMSDGWEPFDRSAEELAAIERWWAETLAWKWTVAARHDATGDLVGYTELSGARFRPWLAFQGDTGVKAEHRNRGIGRWLKAVNALRLLDEYREVQVVETYNAAQNRPMLSINRAMGFVPAVVQQSWQVRLDLEA